MFDSLYLCHHMSSYIHQGLLRKAVGMLLLSALHQQMPDANEYQACTSISIHLVETCWNKDLFPKDLPRSHTENIRGWSPTNSRVPSNPFDKADLRQTRTRVLRKTAECGMFLQWGDSQTVIRAETDSFIEALTWVIEIVIVGIARFLLASNTKDGTWKTWNEVVLEV